MFPTTMVDTITFTLPRDLISVTKLTAIELQLELIIALYSRRKLAFSKARELSGLTLWEFRQLLGQRQIAPDIELNDYLQEIATLQELGQL